LEKANGNVQAVQRRKLQKQTKQINENWDVGAQLQDAQLRMAEATAMMGQQTAATNLVATGIDATATIAAKRDAGGMVNMQPIVEIELTVMPDGRPPYPAIQAGGSAGSTGPIDAGGECQGKNRSKRSKPGLDRSGVRNWLVASCHRS
jgi:hypothetical protein